MPKGTTGPGGLPDHVWRRPDMLAALRARDIGQVFRLARKYAGMSQTAIGIATGHSQGKVSEIMKGSIQVIRLDVFERIADGLNMPDSARLALGLAPRGQHDAAVSRVEDGSLPPPLQVSPQTLDALTRTSTIPVISGLRHMLAGHIRAEAMVGSLLVIDPVRSQIPVVERVCQVSHGADRAEALRFASEYLEFYGWLCQDAGDTTQAMAWTNRALDYALELGDGAVVAYILMRKSNIATESGDYAHGIGLANAALTHIAALTPRLKAVTLRARARAHAHLGDQSRCMEDVEAALKEVAAGTDQKEDDLAPYCTPAYIEMEAGSSWITLGNATKAITTFEDSRSRWSDHKQVRDHALCLARLATAYALSGEGEQACIIAEEVMALTQAVGSGRVLAQLKMLRRSFEKWSHDPFIADFRARLDIVTGTPRFH